MVSNFEDVSKNVPAMHTHQHRIINDDGLPVHVHLAHITHAQRDVWLRVDVAFKGNQCKLTPRCADHRALHRIKSLNERLFGKAMFDDLLDTAHSNAMLGAEYFEIIHSRHVAIGFDDFNNRRGRSKSCQST